jgi:carbonic anhydrase/acetyltransferase-like protein (isoleucine patch superfamily)
VENTVVMEHALVRGRAGHPAVIGDAVMIGPHAHVNGAVVRDEAFVATGASLFPGAVVGVGAEVRINAVVQVNSRVEAGTVVPVGWIAVGDPARLLPPARHEDIWAVQRELDFPRTVYGVARGTPMREIMARQSAFYGSHRHDTDAGARTDGDGGRGRGTDEAERIRARLLGAWRLVTWQSLHPDGTVSHPLGEDALGQLVYTGSGHVSAQLARADVPRFASDDWRRATPQETASAWPAYFGYFGTFSVDPEAGAVVHHIESGWFPNLAGTRQVRHYRFEDDRLVLDADTSWGKVHLVWQKL